jgi:hypothetical protein
MNKQMMNVEEITFVVTVEERKSSNNPFEAFRF